jgi:transcriptional regulator with XRE-family HTH domain/desulfoferrodoxin (superoxide reductase-like protein)
MDHNKVGKLIFDLRKEKGMTQKELADALNLSDRTISKWERGLGCPDVSLLNRLSEMLGVTVDRILIGELDPNDNSGGNMRKIMFYICDTCGNIMFSISDADISCCGRKLSALPIEKEDGDHTITVEEIETDFFITISHDMTKAHYISFVAYISYESVLLHKLYPEQNAEFRLPQMHGDKLFVYCNTHGLFEKRLK